MINIKIFRISQVCSFILIGVLFIGCNTHYFLKSSDPAITLPVTLKKPVKIAYIGFVPFKSYLSASYGRSRTYTAVIDQSNRLVLSEGIATPAYKLKANGLRKDIPKEKVIKFVADYLEITKKSGTEEIIHVVEAVKDGGKTADGKDTYTPQLKNLDVDYYVVGNLSPALQSSNFITVFPHLFSTLFSVVSLGIFPSFQWGNAKMEVKVYDKNLNQVWEKEYDASYTVLRALWAPSYPKECEGGACGLQQSGAVPGLVYKDLIPQVESDLSGFLADK